MNRNVYHLNQQTKWIPHSMIWAHAENDERTSVDVPMKILYAVIAMVQLKRTTLNWMKQLFKKKTTKPSEQLI